MADVASASSSAQPEVEIAEPSALAIHYQVFINHRGPDVKKTLASVVHHTLQRIGIRVFLDKNEMEKGELIWAQIEAAIRSSSVHIAIFSPNYAESRWCLEELCLMMQHPLKILPVFYNVQPADLRWLEKDGPYAEAMRVHQNRGRYDSHTITKWKETLIAVADISGYELKEFNSDEGELVKTIVNNVLGRVKKEKWDVAKYPVGLNEVAEDFAVTMSQINRDYSEKVIVEGIVGMGGIGKTALATHIFNTERSNYQKSCFLPDIRSHNSLTDLQSVLLKDLTGVNERILSVNQGIGIFRDRLFSCRALIILDDIDGINQSDALLVARDVLPPDSRIVITSRDKGLLQRSGISRLYSIRQLSNWHARQLFCWHAFGKPSPVEGFEDLVESFLEVCGGLPLSLKVLGALLCGNDDKVYWRCQLDRVSQRMHADIKERLKISYDALEENCQEMFLDVASFFIGEEKDMAVRIWDGCGWHGLIGVVTLEQRCLLEFDWKGCIRMHDHLRDLGRDIIDDQALKDPQKPRRLWRPGDIEDLLKQASGTAVAIRGVKMLGAPPGDGRTGRRWMQLLRRFWRCFSFEQGHSSMRVTGLTLLDIKEGVPVKGILGRKSKDIRWLRWRGCPYRRLPSWLPTENLSVLQLDKQSLCETLWDDFKQFPAQLRELNVNNCSPLSRCPKSIGDLKHLEKIVLNDSSVKSLPEEFCRLRSLKHLELRGCGSLHVLPKNLGELTNLQHLDLCLCVGLRTLPRSFSGLIQLCHLNLDGCRLLIIPTDILGNISTLRYINFNWCPIEILPSQIIHQTSLQELHLMGSRLKELPENMGDLASLKELMIGSDSLTRLPPWMWTLANLTTSVIRGCPLLKSLGAWECAGNVLGSSSVEHFGGVQPLTNLEHLEISLCPLREVQPFTNVGSVGEEESMVAFTEPRGRLPKLRVLKISGTNIRKIAISEDVCPNLKQLNLSYNQNLVEIEALPHTLQALDIESCSELEKVPHLGGFSALRCIDAIGCGNLKRMEGSEQLKRCNIIGPFFGRI